MQIPADEIAAQLERLLRSKGFASAKKLGRLLSFTVEETMQGRDDQIKESVLGVQVFERPAGFDPRVDPIVRVQAAKLRTRVKEYYEGEGLHDPVRIEYHKGGYAPTFLRPEVPKRSIGRRGSRKILGVAAGLFCLLIGTFYRSLPVTSARGDRVPSIAVLPFTNFSGDPSQDYLSDGMCDELITILSRVEGVRMVARTSVFQFKGKHEDVRQLGARLRASAVLEGSWRRDRDRLRITARLIDVANGYELWSATYERNSGDIFAIQDEISRAIAAALKVQLSAQAKHSISLDAYNRYLQGRYFWRLRTAAGLAKAREYFELALAADPGYAAAYAGLADTWSQLAMYGWAPVEEAGPKALVAARKAVAVDESLGEAQSALGYALAAFAGDWKGSEASFRRAIMLSPGDATPHRWYAVQPLAFFGRLDEALREAQLAVSLDPVSPLVYQDLGHIYAHRHEYDQAIAQYQKALELDATSSNSHAGLGFAYEQSGRADLARRHFLQALEISGRLPASLADLARFDALNGRKNEALDLLREMGSKATPYQLAMVYAALNRKDEAFSQLARGASSYRLPMLERYASLWPDPRYAGFLKQIGVTAGQRTFLGQQ